MFAIGEHFHVNQGMRIEWATQAVKDMRRLAARDRERIVAKIEQYATNPESLANQVVALVGGEYLRMRVGNYRVVFTVERGKVVIMVVLRVRHRREAYA